MELIQKCNNETIHDNYKIYLDYLYSSIINSTDNYESRYSKEIETKILNSIQIKNRKRLFRKIISFGLA